MMATAFLGSCGAYLVFNGIRRGSAEREAPREQRGLVEARTDRSVTGPQAPATERRQGAQAEQGPAAARLRYYRAMRASEREQALRDACAGEACDGETTRLIQQAASTPGEAAKLSRQLPVLEAMAADRAKQRRQQELDAARLAQKRSAARAREVPSSMERDVGRVCCCDGSVSPTCTTVKRGCCSRHGGVCVRAVDTPTRALTVIRHPWEVRGMGIEDAVALVRELMRLAGNNESARLEVQRAAVEAMARVGDWHADYWERRRVDYRSTSDPTHMALMRLMPELGLAAMVSDQKPMAEQPKDGIRVAFELDLQRGSRKAAAVIARRLRKTLPVIAPGLAEQARPLLGEPQLVVAHMQLGAAAITVDDLRCAKVREGFDPAIGQVYVLKQTEDEVVLSADPQIERWAAPLTWLSRCNIGDLVFAPMGADQRTWVVWEIVDVP
ncbi:hypothetical protein [Sorangium sp. So ce176]|uniref:hypothetical protein n=1 Tax=Sorangium sp. So ce176 TaxID=3133286 RepID=UPI003F5F47E7